MSRNICINYIKQFQINHLIKILKSIKNQNPIPIMIGRFFPKNLDINDKIFVHINSTLIGYFSIQFIFEKLNFVTAKSFHPIMPITISSNIFRYTASKKYYTFRYFDTLNITDPIIEQKININDYINKLEKMKN